MCLRATTTVLVAAELHLVAIVVCQLRFSNRCSWTRTQARSVETRSSARKWVGILGNGTLHIGARSIVRASWILNWRIPLLRNLRRRDVFAWGESIAIEPCVLPELERDWKRVDVELLPPSGLIARTVKLAVVDPTNRHGELVAHSVSKRTRLGKREVMRIRRYAAAHKTRLPQDEPPVALITQADGFAQSTGRPASRSLFGLRRRFLTGEVLVGDSKRRRVRGQTIGRTGRGRPVRGLAIADPGDPIPKPLLDNCGIRRCQGVLGRQISLRPAGCLIRRADSR